MKLLLLITALLFSFSSCKEDEETVTPKLVKPVIGTITITAIGNPSDSFRYRFNSSEIVEGEILTGMAGQSIVRDIQADAIYRIYYWQILVNDSIPDSPDTWIQYQIIEGADMLNHYKRMREYRIGTWTVPTFTGANLPATLFYD